MAEVFDTKLTEVETLELTNRLMGFYEKLDTIQDYFLERKINDLRSYRVIAIISYVNYERF